MRTFSRWTLVLAAALPLAAQETFDLSVRARKGDRILFVEATEQLLRVQMPGRDASVDNRLRFERLLLVEVDEEAGEGGYALQLTVLRVHGDVTMPMGREKRFDSADPALRSNNRQMAGISTSVMRMLDQAGLKFRATLDKRGNAKGAFVPSPKAPDADDPATAVDVEKMERLTEALFGRLPGKKVAVGASWPSVQRTTDPSLPTVRRSNVRFAEATDDAFHLVWEGTLAKNEQVQTDPATAATAEGTIRGEQTLDRRTRTVVSAKTTANAKLTIPGAPDTKASMQVTSTLRRGTAKDVQAMTRLQAKGALGSAAEARLAKTRTDVRALAGAVRSFYAKHGRLPDKLAELAAKDAKGRSELEELPNDVWGNPFALVAGDAPRSFYVRSNGPDGKPGTADDIDSRANKN